MNLKDRLANLLRPAATSGLRSVVQTALDAARHAKFAEDYPRALQLLDQALTLAETPAETALVQLQRVEVLTLTGRFEDAEAALAGLRPNSDETLRAYVEIAAGWLAQMRGDLSAARAHYETARAQAQAARHNGAIGRAEAHLADTYWREGNASYALHLLGDALPRFSSSTDIEMSTYFVGIMGRAQLDSGHDTDGVNLLRRAVQLSEQIGYRRYIRLWSLALAERALEEGRYEDAQTHARRVIDHADVEHGALDALEARCLLARIALLARMPVEALSHAEAALALTEHLPVSTGAAANALLRAQSIYGAALRANGRSNEALPLLEAAAASSDGRARLEALRALGAARADTGDIAAAVEAYEAAILLARELDAGLEAAQAHRDRGLVYLRAGQINEAIHEWMQALPLYEDHNAHAQLARLYCDLGGARKQLGQNARALKDYEQALMTLNSVDEADLETRGLVLSSAANAYAEQGDVESADAFFNESITLASRIGDKAAESTRSGNYGWFLLTTGRPRRATASLERALRISEQHGLKLQAAVQTDNLGLVHDALGEYPAALERHRRALALIEPLDQPYWRTVFSLNLSATLIALGEFDEARALIEPALASARAQGSAELIARALIESARLALRTGDPRAADSLLAESTALARRADLRRWLAEALALRSETQAALGDIEEARASWNEARRLYALLHMPQAKLNPAWLEGKASVSPEKHDG